MSGPAKLSRNRESHVAVAAGLPRRASSANKPTPIKPVRRTPADLSVPELFALKEAGYKYLSAIGVECGLHDLRVVQGSQLQLICDGHTLECAIGALAARVLAVAWIGAETFVSHPR